MKKRSYLPLGKIIDIGKNPIVEKSYVVAFIIGVTAGLSIGLGISAIVGSCSESEYYVPKSIAFELIAPPISTNLVVQTNKEE